MKEWLVVTLLACVVLFACLDALAEDTKHYLGFGFRYWRAVEDIELVDVDEDGFSWIVTYQMKPAKLIKIEADIEVMSDNYAGSKHDVYAPQGYILLGTGIYAGLGAGFYLADGKIEENPFLALRAGIFAELFPSIFIDFNANYRFDEWNDLNESDEDIDTDTVTLGLAVRKEF